ncbi:MAG: hypothetical protein AAFZ63_13025 [Bacteroidota bacterium]
MGSLLGEKRGIFITRNPINGKYLICDLSVLNSIPNLLTDIRSKVDSVDYIIHTADILVTKRINTEEGLEKSIALNYYSRVLFNQLIVEGELSYQPERIIHVAIAGFSPPKQFIQQFPLSEKASSFKGYGLGQVANDFYASYISAKLQAIGTKINVLNPGFVDTDIRRKGQFPAFAKKIIFSILRIVWKYRKRTPDEYAKIPLSILQGKNQDADKFILIDENGKGIEGSPRVNNKEVQVKLYEITTTTINDILDTHPLRAWL